MRTDTKEHFQDRLRKHLQLFLDSVDRRRFHDRFLVGPIPILEAFRRGEISEDELRKRTEEWQSQPQPL